MAALAAGRLLLHLRPELELCLRFRALTPNSCRSNVGGRFRYAPPRRRRLSCRQSSYDEGNRRKDGRVLEPMEDFSDDEFMQISLEDEESDGVVCGISESVVQDVKKSAIELLAVRDLLNDGYYAESFSRSRWQSSTWGPKRIKQALRRKGVPEAEVDQATRMVFQDSQGNENQTTHGISEASMNHLFAQAFKKWQRVKSLPLENRRARIVRWLQYRGFNWAVTNAIVRKLEAQHPP